MRNAISSRKKIDIDTNIQMPALKMTEIWQTMDELHEAEQRLALPAVHEAEPPTASKELVLMESREYTEALAELDEEFPDSSEEI